MRILPPPPPRRYTATKSFPYVSGFIPVVLSWVISPLLAGLVAGAQGCVCLWGPGCGAHAATGTPTTPPPRARAAALFLIIRTAVLRRPNSTAIAYWALPVFILITIFINGGGRLHLF